jgi:hypothetical protein
MAVPVLTLFLLLPHLFYLYHQVLLCFCYFALSFLFLSSSSKIVSYVLISFGCCYHMPEEERGRANPFPSALSLLSDLLCRFVFSSSSPLLAKFLLPFAAQCVIESARGDEWV